MDKELIFKSIDNAILKCSSDGTTFSKELSEKLEKFIKKYGDLKDHEELSLYDSQGNLLTHEMGGTHGVDVNLKNYSWYKDLHVFHNHPTAFTDNIPTFLSVSDMKTLLLTNEYGENLLKSVSAVSSEW